MFQVHMYLFICVGEVDFWMELSSCQVMPDGFLVWHWSHIHNSVVVSLMTIYYCANGSTFLENHHHECMAWQGSPDPDSSQSTFSLSSSCKGSGHLGALWFILRFGFRKGILWLISQNGGNVVSFSFRRSLIPSIQCCQVASHCSTLMEIVPLWPTTNKCRGYSLGPSSHCEHSLDLVFPSSSTFLPFEDWVYPEDGFFLLQVIVTSLLFLSYQVTDRFLIM